MRTCHAVLSQVTFAKRVLYMELVIEDIFVDRCANSMLAALLLSAKREKASAETKNERRQCMMLIGDIEVLYDRE